MIVVKHRDVGLKERESPNVFLVVKTCGEGWRENECSVVLVEVEVSLKF